MIIINKEDDMQNTIKPCVLILMCIAVMLYTGCGGEGKEATPKPAAEENRERTGPVLERHPLPGGIKWLTNDADPVFSSGEAKKGGLFRTAIMSFPLTFRFVGPDSNDQTPFSLPRKTFMPSLKLVAMISS